MATVEAVRVRYRVVAPLAIIPDETQGQVYVYFDQFLPSHTDPATAAHLLSVGCVVVDAG